MNEHYAFLLLAAGNSSRMGRAKALLAYKNATLVAHVAAQMRAAFDAPLIAVTGADHMRMEKELAAFGPEVVHNPRWQEGMAGSIRAGMEYLLARHAQTQGVIIAVCDQPYVSAGIFRALKHAVEESGKGMAACRYADTTGTPVLFTKTYFPHLLRLEGNGGAKPLLLEYADDVAVIPFEKGAVDIDTPEDYAQLQNGCQSGKPGDDFV